MELKRSSSKVLIKSCILLIAPLMELKHLNDLLNEAQERAFNRTAYGIETKSHKLSPAFSRAFNRTAYGIET